MTLATTSYYLSTQCMFINETWKTGGNKKPHSKLCHLEKITINILMLFIFMCNKMLF